MNARSACLAGMAAAVLAALPAVWRVEPSLRGQAFWVLLAGAALVTVPLAAALAVATPPSQLGRSLTLGAVTSAVVLVPLATLLKTSTHHRPLGGVTFACLAGMTIVVFSLISSRLITWAGEQSPLRRRLSRLAVVALAALGSAVVLLGLAHGLSADGAFRLGFFDALRVLGFAVLAAWVPVPPWLVRRVRGFGLAAFIAVVTVGVCLGRAPSMQTELSARCPVLQWPLLWLGG